MPLSEENPPRAKGPDLRGKAVHLFTYLKELCQLRFVMVRDCRNYDQVLWFHEIPREKECFCVAWAAAAEPNESWIEVRRSPEPSCPTISDVCKDWVDLAEIQNSAKCPTLRERILTPLEDEKPPTYIELSEHPEVRANWQEYLETKWEPWAKEHQRWRNVQQVYGKLFSIYQQQKRLGESFELRVGLGLLSFQTPSGERIYRHLVIGKANIVFEANRGVISVQASGDGVKLSLEHDMLEPAQLPTPEQYEAVEAGIQANSENIWERDLIEPHLRAWVHAMDQRGHYEDVLQPPSSVSSIPQITFAPALILRRRTARTLVKLLGDISNNLEQGGKIPFGVQRLCEIVEDAAPDGESGPAAAEGYSPLQDTQIYFPLLANDEQCKIVHRLNTGRGVLVQGPPGTGKSHTIANLICHLLAKGKRVLVTSQTPRALKVLQDKIRKDAEQLSPLCVSILGNDTVALKNMESSVLGITERHYDWEAGGKEKNAQTIRRLEEGLYDKRKTLAEIETRLRQLRERESYRHSIASGAYQGTAAHIAQRMVTERDRFGWLPDPVRGIQELPIPVQSFTQLLELLRYLRPERCIELGQPFVAPSDLPDVDAFVRLAAQERLARDVCQSHSSREAGPIYKALLNCGKKERHAALEKLQHLETAVGNIRRHPLPWIPRAVYAVLSDQERSWRELLDTTTQALRRKLVDANLSKRAREGAARHVQLPIGLDPHQLLSDARDLHAHLRKGGRLGFSFLRASVVKRTLYLTHQVRVNGRTCATGKTLSELIEHLDLETSVDALWAHWSGIMERPTGPVLRQVAELEQCVEFLELVLGLKQYLNEAKQAVRELRGICEPAWHEDDAVRTLIADLQAVGARDALAEADAHFAPLAHALACAELLPNAHPINATLAQSVASRDTKNYSDSCNQLRQLAQDRNALKIRDSLLKELKQHLPRLAELLEQDHSSPVWDERLAHIKETWNWSLANNWLKKFQEDGDGEKLEAQANTLQQNIRRTVSELAAEKAWRECLGRLSEAQRQHLMGWTFEIRKIGRGTGVRAEIHRQNARKHLDECRGAVPAWIMPFYRLAETIEAKPEMFDIVIVDEASQSGPDALALLYLAKQIIIVGDDQQISPDAVGVQRSDVDLLSERLIPNLPLRNTFDVESSLFDQAVIRFGRRIVLREHFRCVPEIIRFSNDLCYTATPLIPLRQYPPERLEPLIVHNVANGFREGSGGYARNKPEAEAVVDAILQCAANPRYNCSPDEHHPHGKLTFGVISLQGEEQAKLINQLLLERLTPEEIEQRELVCGDAYAFQGDERDVIFLSLVAAPNERIGALVKASDKRRFNVAASRARDQVWLFHTATLADLNPDDMRYKLLAYCSNPASQAADKPDWSKCESGFERDVGNIINSRNYRLIPQYEPFGPRGYRIDFVIEGLKSRLAVECDGPYHDDPQQIERDMHRQRQLERSDWVFWRISESNFRFDPDKAMSSLWRRLDELGIHPLSAQEAAQPDNPSRPEAPEPYSPAPTLPKAATSPPAPSSTVPRQLDLVAPPQLELEEQLHVASTATGVVEDTRLGAALAYSVVHQLKRSRGDGLFTRDDIGKVALAFLQANPQMKRKELVEKITKALDLPEHHDKRVENAFEALERAGKISISLGANSVSLIRT